MRDDYDQFKALGAHILVVVRDDVASVKAYWAKHHVPYLAVADPKGQLGDLYGQTWRLFKLGLMPAQFVVDCHGDIAFAHIGTGMSDIPPNRQMIDLMKGLADCHSEVKESR